MPSNNPLHGLNIVHPQSEFDHHDLLSQSYPGDLSAQLELWTNLPFESEDGPAVSKAEKRPADDDEEVEEQREAMNKAMALHEGHVNVVTPTNLGTNIQQQHGQPGGIDLSHVLSMVNVDPYLLQLLHNTQQPPQAQQQQQPPQQPTALPSLAQLLAMHAAQSAPQAVFPAPPQPAASTSSHSADATASSSPPAAKRQRTRKSSVSSSPAAESPDAVGAPNTTPLSATEDKRRRNTAASARFRLKKKEREAALETKAKELETRVNELERECEGLRRENGWLKGLVVGVTGAAQGAAPTIAVPPSLGKRKAD